MASLITGFNTDIEYQGKTYHVQTEDKGLASPLILSLVYAGGAILASKRASYDDLIARGFDEAVLAERLRRQHTLICAAIRAGRIEDLKQLGKSEESQSIRAKVGRKKPPAAGKKASAKKSAKEKSACRRSAKDKREQKPTDQPQALAEPTKSQKASHQPKGHTVRALVDEAIADFARKELSSDTLYVRLLDDGPLHGGDRVTLSIKVGRGSSGSEGIANVDVTVKVMGSAFRSITVETKTGADGIAKANLELPHFRTGRAVVLIRAVYNGFEAELRRIIQQG